MANTTDFPSPHGPKPPNISHVAWYGYTQVDSTKPLGEWEAWAPLYNPNATGYERFSSGKVDAQGRPIQGSFEHPDACPPGTTAFGINQCLPVDDHRVAASVNGTYG